MVPPSSHAAKLAVINSLRGVAILAVIHHHTFGRFFPPGHTSVSVLGLDVSLSAPLSHGWLGVDLFFLLSGFVLYLPYASGVRGFEQPGAVADYGRRRFARLMPLYYFNVLIAMAFFFHRDPRAPVFYTDLLAMATATFPFFERLYFPPYNWVLWSLGLEIWFSVLFPVLVWIAHRRGIAFLTVASLLLGLAVRTVGALQEPLPNNPYMHPLKDSLPGRLDEFVVGMLLCSVYLRGPLARSRVLPACVAGGALVFAACALWDGVALGSLPRWFAAGINDVLLLGLFLLGRGLLSLPDGWLRRIVTFGPLQVVGMMCYSLYVWHGMIGARWFTQPGHFNAVHFVSYGVLVFAVAALSYRYIEFGSRKDARALFRGVA